MALGIRAIDALLQVARKQTTDVRKLHAASCCPTPSFWPECIAHPFSVIPAEASECEWSCWNLWQFVQEVPHLFCLLCGIFLGALSCGYMSVVRASQRPTHSGIFLSVSPRKNIQQSVARKQCTEYRKLIVRNEWLTVLCFFCLHANAGVPTHSTTREVQIVFLKGKTSKVDCL